MKLLNKTIIIIIGQREHNFDVDYFTKETLPSVFSADFDFTLQAQTE